MFTKKMRRNLSSQRILFTLEFLQNITTTISTQKKKMNTKKMDINNVDIHLCGPTWA